LPDDQAGGGVAVSEHERTLHSVRATVEEMLAAGDAGGRLSPAFPVDATRVARGPAGCLYRVDPPPEVRLVEDAPVRLVAGSQRVEGRLGGIADESCLVETAVDLGPRVLDGRLAVDNTGPVRALRDRLAALVPGPGGEPDPPTFRFDQAALVLGSPGGRLRDRIAAAAESADAWSLDDRPADVLHAALRYRWASVQSPPGSDAPGLVARLLERLLQFEASVLFVAPTGYGVDRTVAALCERLAGAGRLRSGLVQRVGPLAPGAVRDRFGPYVQAAAIAADLRAGLDERLTALDRLEGRLRFDEAERRVGELDRHAAAVEERLAHALAGRLGRRREDPDALVVQLHSLRTQRRAARETADRVALELSLGRDRVPTAEEVLGEGSRSPAERRRQLAQARDELTAARDGISATLRRRCRVVATTTRSAYTRELPRASFDVVVVAGPASAPEAYWLAGLSTRSVVSVGDSARVRPAPQAPAPRQAPHGQAPRRPRPPADVPGDAHPVWPAWRRPPVP
jgi:hypothetical protein